VKKERNERRKFPAKPRWTASGLSFSQEEGGRKKRRNALTK